MDFLHFVIFSCFSVVHIETSEVQKLRGHVGGEVIIHCFGKETVNNNNSESNRVYFCKGSCLDEKVLIQAERNTSTVTQQGRYIMAVDRKDGFFNVTIQRLRAGDAGRYHCRVGTGTTNMMHQQQVNLEVITDSSVPASLSSHTTNMQSEGNFGFTTEPSQALTLPTSEEKRRNPETSRLTDMTVVILISGSLAILVCAIIPLIFYRHWRRNTDGHNGPEGDMSECENQEENITCVSPSFVSVDLQTVEQENQTDVHNSSMYAASFQALDPKALELT